MIGLGYPAREMRWSVLALLVYVTLDFANPLLPGAVQLVHGTLETVTACHTRSVETPTPSATAAPRRLSTPAPPPAPLLCGTAGRAPRPASAPYARTTLGSRSAPSSSPDDD